MDKQYLFRTNLPKNGERVNNLHRVLTEDKTEIAPVFSFLFFFFFLLFSKILTVNGFIIFQCHISRRKSTHLNIIAGANHVIAFEKYILDDGELRLDLEGKF